MQAELQHKGQENRSVTDCALTLYCAMLRQSIGIAQSRKSCTVLEEEEEFYQLWPANKTMRMMRICMHLVILKSLTAAYL